MFSACCRRPLLLLGAASSCFKYSLIGAENALFYAICILSTIILPRQARDKHRNSENKSRFLQGCVRQYPRWLSARCS